MRRSLVAAALFVVAAASSATGEYRLTLDLVSTGATDATDGNVRLQGSLGESPSGVVIEAPWVLFQGFWFVWREVTGIEEMVPPSDFDFRLDQNAPNPFNPTTRIRFVVPGPAGQQQHARLDVIDVQGRLIHTLVDELLPSGIHEVAWRGQDCSGRPVSSGVYFYRLRAGGQTSTKRLVVIK